MASTGKVRLHSSLEIIGLGKIENKDCKGKGGSLTLVELVSTSFRNTVVLSFSGNSPGVAGEAIFIMGGAIFISGIGTGRIFMDSCFISNVAQVGKPSM